MSLSKQTFKISDAIKFECYIFVKINSKGDTEFWFKGKDIAEFLEYKRPNDAIYDNIKINYWKQSWQELQKQDTSVGRTLDNVPTNWQPHTIFISEPGLWALVSRSKKPEAVKFQKWLFEEVLPSLRRDGGYVMPNASVEQLTKLSNVLLEQMEINNKKDLQLQTLHNELIDSNKQIMIMSNTNENLCNKILEIKPRIAVMPYKKNLQHTIFIYKHKKENKYIFIRPQKRNVNICIKNIVKIDYDLIFKREHVPNSMNILNKIKEKLVQLNVEYIAKRNILSFNMDFNLLTIIQDVYN